MNNQQISVNLGLPQLPNIEDPRLFKELLPIYNAINAVAIALDAYTGALSPAVEDYPSIGISDIHLQNIAKLYPIFSEPVVAGAMINVYNNSGILTARYAKAADATKPARGFSTASVAAGDRGELMLLGLNVHISGLTPGSLYYLSSTSTTGQIVITAPVVSGNVIQSVGFALDANTLFFNPSLLGAIVP